MATTETIRPDGLDVDNVNYVASSGTKYGATSDQSDASYISTAAPSVAITFTLSDLIVAGNTAVERVVIKARVSLDGSGQIGLRGRFGGVDIDQARANLNAATGYETSECEFDITFLRPGGGQWIIDDINNLNAGISDINWTTNQPNILEIWGEVTYAETPSQLPAPREVASRILRQNRTQRDTMAGKVPPEFLDFELLSDFGVVHADAAAEGGAGYQLDKWKRGLFRLESIEVDMNAEIGEGLIYTISGTSLREYAVNLWDDGRALNAGPLQDGAALLDGGQARTFNRDSPAYVEDPSDGRVVGVQYDLEACTSGGRLIEGATKNYIPRSSFQAGATGYTDGGTGFNSSAIDTLEYSDWESAFLFDPKISRYYTRFTTWTGGSPVSPLRRAWPASDTIPAGTDVLLSIDHADVDNEPIRYWLQRAVDGLWWSAGGGGSWGSESANQITQSVSRVRTRFTKIPIGASDTTVTLYVGFSTSALASKAARVFHVQLENSRWATSRIVTGATGATREAATLSYTNNSGNRIWPADRGTVSLKVQPVWSSSAIAAGTTPTVLYCYHDASNYAWLYYDKNNARWTFVLSVAGVVYTAYKAGSHSALATVAIAARWTSADAELGVAAFTLSIFVDGVKGIDAVAPAAMTEAGSSTLYVGHKNGASWMDGSLTHVELLPFVLTDEEIARLAL